MRYIARQAGFAVFLVGLLISRAGASEQMQGCFTRDYDRTHLGQHPDQLTTNVRLMIGTSRPGFEYNFLLQMRLRGLDQFLSTEGYCEQKGYDLNCHVECDGGGITVRPSSGYALMHLDRIRMAACAEDVIDSGQEVSGGKDDRVFRLSRTDHTACIPQPNPSCAKQYCATSIRFILQVTM
jgi:hypothetical protein